MAFLLCLVFCTAVVVSLTMGCMMLTCILWDLFEDIFDDRK